MISKTKPENFKEKFEVVSCFIECGSEILLLHRHDHKPQGNTWGVPAGKIDSDEDMFGAVSREVGEETGVLRPKEEYKYFDKLYVRYDDYDFIYHMFHLPLNSKPKLRISDKEHKDHVWKKPKEALDLPLIQDEDFCIKLFYKI